MSLFSFLTTTREFCLVNGYVIFSVYLHVMYLVGFSENHLHLIEYSSSCLFFNRNTSIWPAVLKTSGPAML